MSENNTTTPEEIAAGKKAKADLAEQKKQEARDELKAEIAAEIRADLLQESAGTVFVPSEGGRKEQKTDANAWLDEKVPIKLFKDGAKYKDDLTLSINSETVSIMRGVPVMVKRKFAMLIDESELQIVKASQYDEEQQDTYKSAVANQAL